MEHLLSLVYYYAQMPDASGDPGEMRKEMKWRQMKTTCGIWGTGVWSTEYGGSRGVVRSFTEYGARDGVGWST